MSGQNIPEEAYFIDEKAAYRFVEAHIWPDGRVCPHCSVSDESRLLEGKSTRMGVYKCYACKKPFTVKVGTVMESSNLPLHLWLQAFFLLATSGQGITAMGIARCLECTASTASIMVRKIRGLVNKPGQVPAYFAAIIREFDKLPPRAVQIVETEKCAAPTILSRNDLAKNVQAYLSRVCESSSNDEEDEKFFVRSNLGVHISQIILPRGRYSPRQLEDAADDFLLRNGPLDALGTFYEKSPTSLFHYFPSPRPLIYVAPKVLTPAAARLRCAMCGLLRSYTSGRFCKRCYRAKARVSHRDKMAAMAWVTERETAPQFIEESGTQAAVLITTPETPYWGEISMAFSTRHRVAS